MDNYIPDYNDFFAMHEAEQERKLARHPICSSCKERIIDDFYYEVNGVIYCKDCLEDEFGRSTNDYMEDF